MIAPIICCISRSDMTSVLLDSSFNLSLCNFKVSKTHSWFSPSNSSWKTDICQRLCGRKIWVCPGGVPLPTKGQKYNRTQMSWPGRPGQDVWDRTQGARDIKSKFWVAPPGHTLFFALRLYWRRWKNRHSNLLEMVAGKKAAELKLMPLYSYEWYPFRWMSELCVPVCSTCDHIWA